MCHFFGDIVWVGVAAVQILCDVGLLNLMALHSHQGDNNHGKFQRNELRHKDLIEQLEQARNQKYSKIATDPNLTEEEKHDQIEKYNHKNE